MAYKLIDNQGFLNFSLDLLALIKKHSYLKQEDEPSKRVSIRNIRNILEIYSHKKSLPGFCKLIAEKAGCKTHQVYWVNAIMKYGDPDFVEAVCNGEPYNGKVYKLRPAYDFVMANKGKIQKAEEFKTSPKKHSSDMIHSFKILIKEIFST